MTLVEYLEKWLASVRLSIATATYQSYSIMMKARVIPSAVQRGVLTPQDIENFYQTTLNDGCTSNTVIHYHAIIRKALQSAVKKDILAKNPADQVDRPKKNVYHGSFYSEEEMLNPFDAIAGGPLELCVKIAAYYGLCKIRFHDLRQPPAEQWQFQIWLGHSTFSATANIYASLDFSAQEQSATVMSGIFQRKKISAG